MIPYHEKAAYDLRCKAEALARSKETVTVELSVPAAWLLRDLLGIANAASVTGVPMEDSMRALNAQLGYRNSAPQGTLPEPDVAGWSLKWIERWYKNR